MRSGSRWWGLLAVCCATFMLLVDITIVQVALPTIQRTLGAGFSDLEWVISGYTLTLAALILTSGTLADRFGRKRVFVGGVVIFTVASLLCGLATSSGLLIGARAMQGVGGAAMFATSLALIGQDFRGPQFASAVAIWGSTVGGAVAVGPLLGGVLTSGLGWQWIFFVNVPVGAAAVAIASTRIANISDPAAKRLDWAGLATLSAGLFLLVFALVRGNDDGWSSGLILSCLGGAAALLAAFVVVELRQPYAMFDLALFRRPAFTGVSVATFAIAAGMFSMFLYLTLYLQNDLGLSPFEGGLRLLPSTLLAFVVPLASRRWAPGMPPGRALVGGMLLVGAGLALMRALLSDGSGWAALLPGLLIVGLGIGLANPAIAVIALRVVPPQRSGMASGISNTFRIAGVACGVAALGAIFQGRVSGALAASLGSAPASLTRAVASGGTQAVAAASGGQARVISASHQAFVSSLSLILVVGAVIALAGALAAIMVRGRDFQAQAAPAARAAPADRPAPAASAD